MSSGIYFLLGHCVFPQDRCTLRKVSRAPSIVAIGELMDAIFPSLIRFMRRNLL